MVEKSFFKPIQMKMSPKKDINDNFVFATYKYHQFDVVLKFGAT